MAIENINVGTAPNSSDGDNLRDAFIVVNGNFAQIDTKSETDAKIISATNPLLVRINDVEGVIEQINTELDTLSTISYVDAQIALVNSNINTVDNKVNLLDTDVDALTIRVGNIETILPNKLNDAPSDGYQYGRKDGQWVVITGGGTIDAYTKSESDALFSTKTETNTLDAQNVKISGNQSIAGVKTFSASPIVPTPTTNTQATNKSYVDSVTASKANQTEITRIDNELTAKANTTTVNTLDAQNVKITGNQTIGGVKAFSSSPTVPAPTVDNQVANKKYVDDAVAGGGGDLSNYYTKAQTDTEIEDAISNLHTIVSAEIITEVTKSRRIIVSTGTATVETNWSKCLIICTVNTLITIPNNPGVIDFWVKAANGVTVTFASSGSNISPNSTGTTISSKNMGFVYCANQNHTITEFATGGSTGDDNVKLTGNQTVAGVKTFSESPIVPTPTTATQATNKTYVDSALNDKANTTTVNSLDAQNVKITGDQTVAGVKTFSTSPKAPVAIANNDVVIKQQMDSALGAKSDITYVNTQLALKANQSTTYTKTETDTLLTSKANQSTTYTKTEVDTALSGKVSQAYFDTFESETEADIIALENAMPTKADKATTYTKTEVDNKFWFGTQAQYDAITIKDPNVMYFIEEE